MPGLCSAVTCPTAREILLFCTAPRPLIRRHQNLRAQQIFTSWGLLTCCLKLARESITDADITDLRMESSLCGIITGSLEITDTTEIFAQFKAIFQGFLTRWRQRPLNWRTLSLASSKAAR